MTGTLYWMPVEDAGPLKNAKLRQLFALWSEASVAGRPPAKDFVDPARFGELMDWLFLYKVERHPLRFQYLISGPKLVSRFGLDLTGKYVDEHPDPAVRKGILANLTAVVATAKPHRRLSVRRLLDHDVTVEALVLPLTGPDGAVDHLVALQVPETPDASGP